MKITLAHGEGGEKTSELIKKVFLKHFTNPYLEELGDSAIFSLNSVKGIAFTTDSYTVKPLFFPGGSIGKLAISGTVNDILVSGAKPLFISCGFILEEGLELSILDKVVDDMKSASSDAGVEIVCGDTKVVEKGKCDGLYINTSGIGVVIKDLSHRNIEPGDCVVLTGGIGEHAISVFIKREEIDVETSIESDCAPLVDLLIPVFDIEGVKWMRDPTRGGLATTLLELSELTGFQIEIWEESIPIREDVAFICETFGLDPLYLANEGKAVIVVSKKDVEKLIEILRKNPKGKMASLIGIIKEGPRGVVLKTKIGGLRSIDYLEGVLFPRIC